MTEQVHDKVRKCVLETSQREFAVRDTMQKYNGQYGQRVHLDPRSPAGVAYMHNPQDGWMSSCYEGTGWGVPISAQ
eukprot:6601626-Karenia_brevis.AAC.1